MLFVRSTPSTGARLLASELGARVCTPADAGSRRRHKTVINWGVPATFPTPGGMVRMLNSPEAVSRCRDKRETFNVLDQAGVETLEHSHSYTNLREKYPDSLIVARTTVTGSNGAGVKLLRPGDEPVEAPLYTRYFDKRFEVRVHVVNGKAILTQQKRRRRGEERGSSLVRTDGNNWVLVPQLSDGVISKQDKLNDLAIRAVQALGLDFGAVDILIGSKRSVVCEVNSRPGIGTETTIKTYAAAFKELLRNA